MRKRDDATRLEKKWFTYDARGNLTRSESWLGLHAGQPVYPGDSCSQDAAAQCTKVETTPDAYGNVVEVTAWQSSGVSRLTKTTFDSVTSIYPVIVENPLGQKTASTHDPACGLMLSESITYVGTTVPDARSHLRHGYDAFCRLTSVWRAGEDETAAGSHPYRAYDYRLGAPQQPTVTQVFSREPSNVDGRVTSAVIADALGRVLQEKRESVVDGTAAVVTTSLRYDAQNRPVRQYLPVALGESTSFLAYSPPAGAAHFTALEYDALGRMTKSTNPDAATFRTVDYSVAWETKSRDECHAAAGCNGLQVVERRDGLGRVVERIATAESGAVLAAAQTAYDENDRPTSTVQGDGATWREATRVTTDYDSLGRRVRVSDPDSGVWTYAYDWAGNLVMQDDPAASQHVQVCYDALERVRKRKYLPWDFSLFQYFDCAQNATDQITHTYDLATEGLGRPYQVTDRSGTTTHVSYSILGLPLRVDRTMGAVNAQTEYVYDANDRVLGVHHPDQEWVLYGYDGAGRVYTMQNISGKLVYLKSMTYDVLGRPRKVRHGNGANGDGVEDERTYAGGGQNLRLTGIAARSGGTAYVNYGYTAYAPTGRLTAIVDSSAQRPPGVDGSASYSYDSLGRLTEASGGMLGTRAYEYDIWGNIKKKEGRTVSYQTTRPHTPNVFNSGQPDQFTFQFDSNGNNGGKAFGQTGEQRYYYDRDNRVRLIDVGGQGVAYAYDYAGMRSRETRGAVQYASPGNPSIVDEETTYYYTPFLEVTETASTAIMRKYYVAGGLLIASREFPAPAPLITAHAGAPPVALLAMFDRGAGLVLALRPDAAAAAAVAVILGGSVLLAWPRRRRAAVVGVTVRPADAVVLALAVLAGTMPWPLVVRPAHAKPGPTPTMVPTAQVHHYHLDHLGSPLLVTDNAGAPIRWTRYAPYGQILGRWDGPQPTAFTEQDSREFTGYDTEPLSALQYAGARFYDPALGLFLTHDPLREFASPYTYTNWDPVNARDPSGAALDWITLAIVGFIVGFTASAIQAGVNGASIGDAFKAGAIGGAIGAVSAPLGAYVLTEAIGPALAQLTAMTVRQATDAAGTALLLGSLGQAAYGLTQNDYTGVIGLGLSVGIGLALGQRGGGAQDHRGDACSAPCPSDTAPIIEPGTVHPGEPLADPVFREQMLLAWEDSNPGVYDPSLGPSPVHEEGGYLLPGGGVDRWTGTGPTFVYPGSEPSSYLGSFHTHPFAPGSVASGGGASLQDYRWYSNLKAKTPHYIIAWDGIYRLNPDSTQHFLGSRVAYLGR